MKGGHRILYTDCTQVLIQDPCTFGLPAMLTIAQISILRCLTCTVTMRLRILVGPARSLQKTYINLENNEPGELGILCCKSMKTTPRRPGFETKNHPGRAPKDHINTRIYKPWFLVSPLYWALEPESEILLFMCSFGPLYGVAVSGHGKSCLPCQGGNWTRPSSSCSMTAPQISLP